MSMGYDRTYYCTECLAVFESGEEDRVPVEAVEQRSEMFGKKLAIAMHSSGREECEQIRCPECSAVVGYE